MLSFYTAESCVDEKHRQTGSCCWGKGRKDAADQGSVKCCSCFSVYLTHKAVMSSPAAKTRQEWKNSASSAGLILQTETPLCRLSEAAVTQEHVHRKDVTCRVNCDHHGDPLTLHLASSSSGHIVTHDWRCGSCPNKLISSCKACFHASHTRVHTHTHTWITVFFATSAKHFKGAQREKHSSSLTL